MRLVISTIFIILMYAAVLYLGDTSAIVTQIARLDATDLILGTAFTILALFFEFLRWAAYMRDLHVSLPLTANIRIFLSGLAFSFLPSKSGELMRYHLLRKENIRLATSLPIHFISNMTNLLVVALLASPILIELSPLAFIITIALVLVFFVSLQAPLYIHIGKWLHKKTRIRIFKELVVAIKAARKLMHPKTHLIALLTTTLSYLSMAGVIFVVRQALGIETPLFILFSLYLLSLIIGVISMLPGGVGAVEGSAILFYSQFMDQSNAISLILMTRFFTLWLTTIFGAISLLHHTKTNI
ncbi:MAG: lysylphosphatidylglycerol synthase transmembrane domain-containing protein [Nanobdellota archaeon]